MDSDRLTSLELRSMVSPHGRLELSLARTAISAPEAGEIIVRIEAAPVNPSDLGLLLGPADPAQGVAEGEGEGRRRSIPLSPQQAGALSLRTGLSLCPGLEGAGTVVAAGAGCEPLIGKTIALFGGGMYAQYRKVRAEDCLVFPDGTTPAVCAASFVNPLTALGMIETMRRENHRALIHTAAASNLGQMLGKLCREDSIELIEIVRKPAQAEMLRDLGSRRVCDSSAPDFVAELTAMIRETGATLAFDAIGGGMLASTILRAMETVYAPPPERFSIYGSAILKQIYVYGMLDTAPIQIVRGIGNAWSVSGWLLMNRLATFDAATIERMKARIVRQIDSNFSSHYTGTISLSDALDAATLTACSHRSTGAKYLLDPHRTA